MGSLGKDSATESLGFLLLLVEESLVGLLALLLKSNKDLLVLPADFVGKTTDGTETTTRLQTEDTEGSRDNHALGHVELVWDSLEHLQALHGSSTTGGLVGEHTAGDTEEDAAGCTVMEGTVGGVDNGALAQELVVLHYKQERLN